MRIPTQARLLEADYDLTLIWVVLSLLGLGVVMVYSASIAFADAKHTGLFQSSYYLVRQSIYVGVGLIAAYICFQVPLKKWQEWAPLLFLAGIFLLILVLVPGIGKVVNGSRRWLSLYVINVQPSELMKLFAAFYAADYILRRGEVLQSFTKAFVPMLVVVAVCAALLLAEPDFGALSVITAIAIGILFLGGVNGRQFLGITVALAGGAVLAVISSPYRWERATNFMDPWADALGAGYQLSHALIAFGRGEWLGVGLGGSVEKLFYLPEAHTDFLLAVIGEELGFAAVLLVIGAFAWLTHRAFFIARQAAALDRLYGALVAYGIGIWIGGQGIINIGVNVGLLPTKGLTLPFLSYGGTGIVANCIAMAVLLRVDWENRQVLKGYKV